MLGTNDTKLQFDRTAVEITEGMRQLVKIVKLGNEGPMASAPKIIIISPQPIIEVENLHPEFAGKPIERSEALSALYEQMAIQEECGFLDAALFVSSSKVDGVHLDEKEHELLGNAMAAKVVQILK
jgi:lysophospholipase L1-like esterase